MRVVIEKQVSKDGKKDFYRVVVLVGDLVICTYWLNKTQVELLKMKGLVK